MNVKVCLDEGGFTHSFDDALQGGAAICLLNEWRKWVYLFVCFFVFSVRLYLYACGLFKKRKSKYLSTLS